MPESRTQGYHLQEKAIIVFVLILVLFTGQGFGQSTDKSVAARKLSHPISIDGKLNDQGWKDLPVLSGFTQYFPYNNRPPTKPTIARIGYDNAALYLGIYCQESSRDSISVELSQRDDMEVYAEMVGFLINPYNDGINGFYFMVSAAGVQVDFRFSESDMEPAWDAVWESEVSITDTGWIAEIRIPYSALRFPDQKVQDWGINIWRRIARKEQWSSWNYVSNEIEQWWIQTGQLTGIEILDPPLRLSFMPYVSAYLDQNLDQEWNSIMNAGMDMKLGISESFTLDAILIPDFGQVEADDQVLNLSPYEIRYNEKRQFFTEGMEMFNRAGIFYSRRIGSEPAGYGEVDEELKDHEKLKKNPTETKLLNAVKLSGRTRKGLGMGILNAMTSNTFASIEDTISGEERKITTQGFTNYNVMVLEQVLYKNSFVSFINSNVTRKDFSANVSGMEFRLTDKKNIYTIDGSGAFSQWVNGADRQNGYKYNLNLGKTGGKLQYMYSLYSVSDHYNQNDLGYLRRNNELNNEVTVNYRTLQPFGIFLFMNNEIGIHYNRMMNPDDFSELLLMYEFESILKNQYYVGIHSILAPVERHDYFETRTEGRYVKLPKFYNGEISVNSDPRKSLSVFSNAEYTASYNADIDVRMWSVSLEPNYRVSNKFNLGYEFSYHKLNHEIGFVSKDTNDIIYFGIRDRKTISNTVSAMYLFSNKASLNFRLRHYWSQAWYDNYYTLATDGRLFPAIYDENHDINYSAFNIDMTFVWNFAPGSELRLNWKNASYLEDNELEDYYYDNLRTTLDSPHANMFSIKVLYYLDYLSLKRFLHPKDQ